MTAFKGVEQASFEAERLVAALNSGKERAGSLTVDLNLQKDRLQKLDETRLQFEEDNRLWRQKEDEADEAADRMMREQAGLLAQNLVEGKPCPVCGSYAPPSSRLPFSSCSESRRSRKMSSRGGARSSTWKKEVPTCMARAKVLQKRSAT